MDSTLTLCSAVYYRQGFMLNKLILYAAFSLISLLDSTVRDINSLETNACLFITRHALILSYVTCHAHSHAICMHVYVRV